MFQIYCSYGDPMNTKSLKSSKLKKMLKDCGLLEGISTLPQPTAAKQISLPVMDLMFKQVCATVCLQNSMQNTLSVIQDCSVLD